MTIEQIKKSYNSQPFQPFTIHLAGGREVPVPHRDFIMVVPNGRTLVVALPDSTVDIIDLLLVSDVVVGTSKNGSNGHKKRGRSA
ncbi:MAG TPA: hypothetical protein VH107_08395 [Lacipirellulaceae bacterium]|jgi:hypothetical protein|nr:hypothetical protein [Lacipirellulaceae bacterium]